MWQAPIKTSGSKSLMSFPVRWYFTCLSLGKFDTGEIEHVCLTLQEKTLVNLDLFFFLEFCLCMLSLCDFFFASLCGINHSEEYNCRLRPMSLPQFSSVTQSCPTLCDPMNGSRPPCPSPTPGVQSNSRPSSQWCHPAISSSVVPFSSCPQSLPASESFPMSQLFTGGGQNTGVSALASFPPKKSQGWSPSEWNGWIPLQSRGLSRVISNTTIQRHQFFGVQLSSQSNCHIHTWPLEKP